MSTAEAYAWYDEDRAAGLREARELQQLPVPWPSRAAQMINDLEPPVLRRHPEIGTLKAQLREAGAIAAAMSGSGSAVFGLFRSRAAAERMVKPLCRGGARALLTRTLSRAEHERRARPVARRRGSCKLILLRTCQRVAPWCPWLTRRHPPYPCLTVADPRLGRGQAVRRGTLDPVFGGSNPPAPTMLIELAVGVITDRSATGATWLAGS